MSGKRARGSRARCKCGHTRYGGGNDFGHCNCHRQHYCLTCEDSGKTCRYRPRKEARRRG